MLWVIEQDCIIVIECSLVFFKRNFMFLFVDTVFIFVPFKLIAQTEISPFSLQFFHNLIFYLL